MSRVVVFFWVCAENGTPTLFRLNGRTNGWQLRGNFLHWRLKLDLDWRRRNVVAMGPIVFEICTTRELVNTVAYKAEVIQT